MVIVPFEPQHIAPAAEMFIAGFQRQRLELPELPEEMCSPERVTGKIEQLMQDGRGFAALEGSRLVGYLGGWVIDGFRDTPRRGAYCPEWGHGAVEGRKAAIYRGLYRAAAARWLDQGVQTHALTLLSADREGLDAWFWSGFGLLVVDAVRGMQPLGASIPEGYTLRQAESEDVPALAEIEAEHWRHYAEPPTLMMAEGANSADEIRAILGEAGSSFWGAWQGDQLAAYLRFAHRIPGAAEIINGPGTMAITGAYTRPDHRGHGLAPALLDAALRSYAARGYQRCVVDFESINPEAAAFWPRYFKVAALSVMRVPEREK